MVRACRDAAVHSCPQTDRLSKRTASPLSLQNPARAAAKRRRFNRLGFTRRLVERS
jgi:hypothetical protein